MGEENHNQILHFISSSTSSSSSDIGEFLSESEPFEQASDEEIVPSENHPVFSFLSSDSSTFSSTNVSPLINKVIDKQHVDDNDNEKIIFNQTNENQIEETKNVKINDSNQKQQQQKPISPSEHSSYSSYSYYSSASSTTPATSAIPSSSVTYSNASTSPIRFTNSPLRKNIKHIPSHDSHKKRTRNSIHHRKKAENRKYKMTQAGQENDDYDSYYEEEDIMNSSDRRFIADSSSQSQVGNEPALYRIVDMSQRKPNPNYKVNKRKRLIDEYSPSQSDVDPSLSDD